MTISLSALRMDEPEFAGADETRNHSEFELEEESRPALEASFVSEAIFSSGESTESDSELDPESDSKSDSEDDDYEPGRQQTKSRTSLHAQHHIVLDLTKTSNAAGSKIAQVFIPDVAASRKTVANGRKNTRQVAVEVIKEEVAKFDCLFLHIDGKKMKDIGLKHFNNILYERIAIMITAPHYEQILSFPILQKATAQVQVEHIAKVLNTWNISSKIVGICYDTAATNTGWRNGIGVQFDRLIGRTLVKFSCRHHSHERVINDVYLAFFKSSPAPEVEGSKVFQTACATLKIDQLRPSPGTDDEELAFSSRFLLLANSKGPVLNRLLDGDFARQDYKEMIELSLWFLGEFKGDMSYKLKPGTAVSEARWMGKIIYRLKKFLLRDVLPLKELELEKTRQFLLFAMEFYVVKFIESPLSIEAARNDIEWLKELHQAIDISDYDKDADQPLQKPGRKKKDDDESSSNVVEAIQPARTPGRKKKEVLFEIQLEDQLSNLPNRSQLAKIAIDKLMYHLWFLHDKAMGFAFFDETISEDERNLMAAKINIEDSPKFGWGTNKLELKYKDIASIRPSHFISKNTKEFFTDLKLSLSFLSQPASSWPTLQSYIDGKNYVRNVLVVNDAAERAVRLVQDYKSSRFYDETDFQNMLCTVFRARKE